MKQILVAMVLAVTTVAARAEDEQRRRADDAILIDPVCGSDVRDKSDDLELTIGGAKIFFCNQKCMLLFLENRDKYAVLGTSKRAAAETSGSEETRPEGQGAPAPAYDENAPIKNSDWRNLMQSARQVREASMTIMVLALTLFSMVVLGGLVLFTAGLAPNAVARSSVATRDHPVRAFFIGAVVLSLGTIATVVTKGLLGIVIAPVLVSALLIGLAGVSEHLGRNLWHLAGKEGNRIGHIAAGWGTFSLVALVPLVGWFGFLPYYASVGVGSFFAGLVGGRRPEAGI